MELTNVCAVREIEVEREGVGGGGRGASNLVGHDLLKLYPMVSYSNCILPQMIQGQEEKGSAFQV